MSVVYLYKYCLILVKLSLDIVVVFTANNKTISVLNQSVNSNNELCSFLHQTYLC